MRTLFAAAIAGGLIGFATAPEHSQAVQWPVTINFDYCWGSAVACPHVQGQGQSDFIMEQNGTFTDTSGSSGTWQFSKALGTVSYVYSNGTVYDGNYVGGGCFDGTMLGYTTSTGTWAGCKQ